jgi:hypothetical protein
MRSHVWLIHFHQFPCVQAPIPVGSCYVLPVSPGTDGRSRLIWNLSGSCQEPWRLPVKKNIDVPNCSPFLYSTLYKPWWHIFQPGIPRCCCVPFLSAIYTPQILVPLFVSDPSVYPLRCLSWTCSANHTCQKTWPWIACGMWMLEASYQSPICRMGSWSISPDFFIWPKLVDLGIIHTYTHIYHASISVP